MGKQETDLGKPCEFCNDSYSEGATCAGCGKAICWDCDVGFVIYLCEKCDGPNNE